MLTIKDLQLKHVYFFSKMFHLESGTAFGLEEKAPIEKKENGSWIEKGTLAQFEPFLLIGKKEFTNIDSFDPHVIEIIGTNREFLGSVCTNDKDGFEEVLPEDA